LGTKDLVPVQNPDGTLRKGERRYHKNKQKQRKDLFRREDGIKCGGTARVNAGEKGRQEKQRPFKPEVTSRLAVAGRGGLPMPEAVKNGPQVGGGKKKGEPVQKGADPMNRLQGGCE